MISGVVQPSSPLAGEERDLVRNELSRSGEGVFGAETPSHQPPTAPSPTTTRRQAAKSSYPLPQGERKALRPVTDEQFETTLLARAKYMRANPTDAERRLWSILRNKRLCGYKFKRQVIIDWYIVDFINFEHRLIVEADGSQHADSDYDRRRDTFLRGESFTVLRFWNNDILGSASGVFDAIYAALCPPHPPTAARQAPPSPARGEGLGTAKYLGGVSG